MQERKGGKNLYAEKKGGKNPCAGKKTIMEERKGKTNHDDALLKNTFYTTREHILWERRSWTESASRRD